MDILVRLITYSLFLGLTACMFLPRPSAQSIQCQQVCITHFEFCKQHCTNNCPNCSHAATESAETKYTSYLHEMHIQGLAVTRNLKSFRDPLQCRKVSCNCSSDFITCKQSCTGVIPKKLRSLPYCP